MIISHTGVAKMPLALPYLILILVKKFFINSTVIIQYCIYTWTNGVCLFPLLLRPSHQVDHSFEKIFPAHTEAKLSYIKE